MDQGKVADFQVEAVVHEDVGLPPGQDHARFGLDHVRVLARLHQGGHGDLVPADLLGQAADPGKRGDHVQPGKGGGGNHQRQEQHKNYFSHNCILLYATSDLR